MGTELTNQFLDKTKYESVMGKSNQNATSSYFLILGSAMPSNMADKIKNL